MMIVIFFLLVLMPVLLVFANWVATHRRGTTQVRVHTKEHQAANGAFDLTRYLIQNNMAGSSTWSLANNYNTAIYVDSGTIVTAIMTNVGRP